MNYPRPLPVYLASEVIKYCQEKRDVDVTPYIKKMRENSGPEVICVNPNAPQLKMRELKDVIYDLFGANVFIMWDVDGDAEEMLRAW